MGVYRDSFTQGDVDAMIGFYRSNAGQAVIRKMPAVMQASMAEMQNRMKPMMQKLKRIEEETVAEIRAQQGTDKPRK
jgi:hypothetical protein